MRESRARACDGTYGILGSIGSFSRGCESTDCYPPSGVWRSARNRKSVIFLSRSRTNCSSRGKVWRRASRMLNSIYSSCQMALSDWLKLKASERGINVAKSAELAKRLRPDMVTLAILEAPSPGLGAKLEELRRQLAGSDIAANVMTLDPDDVDDLPSLPPVHHTGCVCSDLLAGQEGGRRRQLQCIAGCSGGDKRLRLSPFAPSHSPPGMSPVCAKPTSAGLMPTGEQTAQRRQTG